MNRHRPQDDLPYEYRMKYIIEDYIKIRNALDMIEPYTKELEETVQEQHKEIEKIKKMCDIDHIHEFPARWKKIHKTLDEIEEIKKICKINSIKELPNKWIKMEKAFDDTEYAELAEKYKELRKMYQVLEKDVKSYNEYIKSL